MSTRLSSTSESNDHGNCTICCSSIGPKDYAIVCEFCKQTFHHGCAGFNDTTYKAFNKMRLSGVALHHCDQCKREITLMKSKVAQLESGPSTVANIGNTRLDTVEKKIDRLTDALKTIIGPDIAPSIEPTINAQQQPTYASIASKGVVSNARIITVRDFNKIRDEEAHRRSLVVAGLPENGKDLEDVASLARFLDPSASVNEVFRMGRLPESSDNTTPRPRLLKVHVASSSVVRSLLSQSHRLKNSDDFKGIFIRRSMTLDERKAVGKLRERCRELNSHEAVPRTKYVVLHEKLVKFTGCDTDESGRLVGGVRNKSWVDDDPPCV